MLACVIGSAGASCVLRAAEHRNDAVLVVPIAIVWGVAALGAAWTMREARIPIAAAFAAALAVRTPLVGSPAQLSDDLYRYLWEGLVLANGVNPFLHAPATVDGLDDALRSAVNHPTIPSIYPPVALAWFRLLDALGGTPLVAQAAAGLADAGTAAALAAVLVRRGRPVWPALLWALHPLPALESAANAHLEAPAVLLMVLAVLAHDHHNAPAAGFLSLAGAAVKPLPVLLLAPILRASPARAIAGMALAAALTGLLALPVIDAGHHLFDALRNYEAHWSFNGLAFALSEPILGGWTRRVLQAIGAAVVLVAWARLRDPVDVWAVAGAAFFLLTPTAHPWYALWALAPHLLQGRWGWAAAGVPILGSYLVLLGFDPTDGSWTEPGWLLEATWGPALLALGAGAITSRNEVRPIAAYPPANSARNGTEAQ